LVLSPVIGYPRYATELILTLLVYERCVIIYSLANQALPAVYQEKMKESRKGNVQISYDGVLSNFRPPPPISDIMIF